ncbi:MAG TPA: CBS domain-containing protein [Polyangiales bacterium]|nr:CBS domain-containing protein [Polyangiales bacterium]
MTSPVFVVRDTDRLDFVERELAKLGISAMPVTDRSEAMIGVITRSDLLRVGRVRPMNGHRRKLLTLPQSCAREVMTSTVEIVSPAAVLADVARRMVRQHIHRLYVSDDRRPLGVVSTKDVMNAIAAARIATPIGELVHRSVVSVHANDPVSLAIDRLAASHHRAVIVMEDAWPVGVFTQADALAARDAPSDDRVDQWMDPRVLCVPLAMPAFRVAEQLSATRARLALAVDAQGTRGVVTGIDFARFVSHEA